MIEYKKVERMDIFSRHLYIALNLPKLQGFPAAERKFWSQTSCSVITNIHLSCRKSFSTPLYIC